MFTYICFYKGRKCVVNALRSFDAQEAAAKIFKAKRAYEIAVMLAAKPTGEPVIHSTASI